jgi:hypothetical protein
MSQEKVFQAGGVELRVDNRTLGADGGPAVRVYGDVDGESVQLLRFDCFQKNPHYHYAPSGRNEQHHLDGDTVPDSIGWTIEQLGHNLAEMIHTAGYDGVAAKVDQAAVRTVLPEVESIMRG